MYGLMRSPPKLKARKVAILTFTVSERLKPQQNKAIKIQKQKIKFTYTIMTARKLASYFGQKI